MSFDPADAISLPDSNGDYSVGIRVYALIDTDRMDPYAPKDAGHHRQVMISMLWPIEKSLHCIREAAPYMPPATAKVYGQYAASMGLPFDTFTAMKLNFYRAVQDQSLEEYSEEPRYPLAIFSPGSGVSRLAYTALSRALASRGYVVVTVDHPYDADIVEFPDGKVVLGTDLLVDNPTRERAIQVRSEDISFVVSQFQDASSCSRLTHGLPGTIDLGRIVVWGHSLGGATAAQMMLRDDRIHAGANLDGRLSDPVLSTGLEKPFLLFGRAGGKCENPTWSQFWEVFRDSKIELTVAGATHQSFIDYPFLVEALSLLGHDQSLLESVIGSIAGTKMQNILADTLDGFFSFVLDRNFEKYANAIKTHDELLEVNNKLC